MNESIYLDNHSATKPCQPALERMKPYLEDPSFAPHRLGKEQIAAIDGNIEILYDLVGATGNDRFAFTSSGAEAVQQVLWSVYLETARPSNRRHFVMSCLEDGPTAEGMKRLEDLGCQVEIAPCDGQGRIDVAKLGALIRPETALVSVCLAQGLTGIVQPIAEIAKICREKNTYLHVDATYAIGKIALDFVSDYMTFAGDRMHALMSSGALFAKAGRPLSLLFSGAFGIDIPSLVSLSAAAQQSLLTLDMMGLEVARLRDRFEQGILQKIPQARVLFSGAWRLPNVSLIAFDGIHQEALLYALHKKKLYASIGGESQDLSRLLLAAGLDERTAKSAISFALSRMTSPQEIGEAVLRIADAVPPLLAAAGEFA
jgi:cysteine desulfurase